MSKVTMKKIVIVGGGSAGWLVAGILASRFSDQGPDGLDITLIESGDIPTLGVGEGTWPSMRSTLRKIGISEKQFISSCNASFKQGSKFINWQYGENDSYYHPFQMPAPFSDDFLNVLGPQFSGKNYAECVCPHIAQTSDFLAPRLITSDDYSHLLNYGYHLDARKFGHLLRDHATHNLGVNHIVDTVKGVVPDEQGHIRELLTESGATIPGNLFVDCSGFASILMKGHFQIPFVSCRDYLFNDAAIAVQIPYANDQAPINSFTLSTAQSAGWIWDIGLTSRRGVGYTYSSDHCSAEAAQRELARYVEGNGGEGLELDYRNIKFDPGHLAKFWHKNCVAIGVSAGFLEPLEASALVTIELAANMLADNLPASEAAMVQIEKQFNKRFTRHWEHIIEFLKLHYVLSSREDSAYWQDNRRTESQPDTLTEKLAFWKHFSPSRYDDVSLQELFPSASYQYILYGMGYSGPEANVKYRVPSGPIIGQIERNWRKAEQLSRSLPSNRELLNALAGSYQPNVLESAR